MSKEEELLTGYVVGEMIGNSIAEPRNKEGSGLGVIIFFVFALFFCYILMLKIGVDPVHIKTFVKWAAMPFIWDYYINFTVYDLNQYLFAAASLFMIVFLYFFSMIFIAQILARSLGAYLLEKPYARKGIIRTFAVTNITVANVYTDLIFVPLMVVWVAKFIIHSFLATMLFLFSL